MTTSKLLVNEIARLRRLQEEAPELRKSLDKIHFALHKLGNVYPLVGEFPAKRLARSLANLALDTLEVQAREAVHNFQTRLP